MKKMSVRVAIATVAFLASVGIVNAASDQSIISLFKGGGNFLEVSRVLITKGLRVIGNASIEGWIATPGSRPVTIADDLRVDGKIFRGTTAGSSDNKPVKVDDSMTVDGNLTVSGIVTAATLQELIGGTASASSVRMSSTNPTTWAGTT